MDLQLSVVVPCFNEEGYIGSCIASLREALQDIRHEIIVLDNGSTDQTAAIAQQFSGVAVHSIVRATIGCARNIGVCWSSANLIAFIDADVVVTRGWGDAITSWIQGGAGTGTFIGGATYAIRDRASIIERAWFMTLSMVPAKYLNGGNIVVSRQAFDRIGGFDQFLQTGEDFDFCQRAEACGMTIVFEPRLEAIHLGYPAEIGQFFRRESWHGIGDFQSLRLFVNSKIALTAMMFFVLIAMAVPLWFTGSYRAVAVVLGAHLALPMLFTLYKFRFANGRYFVVQSLLSYVYLWARIYSPVRLMLGRR